MKANFTPYQPIIRAIQAVLLLTIFIYTPVAFSQSVTILPDGITPNQSGGMPRLSYDAIAALPNPQNGDMAYDLTFNIIRLYKKNQWVKVLTGTDASNPSLLAWKIGQTNLASANAVATDSAGNVYTAGYFKESAKIGNTYVYGLGYTGLTLFIAKSDKAGNILWVQTVGYSLNSIQANELVLDNSGNIYLTGYFHTSAVFGATNFTSAGLKDIYIAKFNNTGNLQWVQKAGGPSHDEATDLAIAGNGDLYMSGYFGNNAVFNGTTYAAIGNDVFVAKYDNSGGFQWIQKGGGTQDDKATGIAVNTDGEVTVIGEFVATATFGANSLVSQGYNDIFMLRYSSAGVLAWAKRMGGAGSDSANDIVTNTNKELYMVGEFSGTATIGSNTLTSMGGTDIYIAKFTNAGIPNWTVRDGGSYNDFANSIFLGYSGNVYIAGSFLNSTIIGKNEIYGKGGLDIFIAKYDISNKLQWVKTGGGEGQEEALKITGDSLMNIYCTGTFDSSFSIDDNYLSIDGFFNAFVFRIRD